MRRPWIKVETATPDKPEICTIAASLRLSEDAVLGKLVRLWSWVEVNHIPANDLGVTKEFLDKLVGRKGFSSAMIDCGWLLEGDGKLGLKNLERHNGSAAKVRALTAHRVALHRKRKLKSITNALQNEAPTNEAKEEDASTLNTVNNVSSSAISLISNQLDKLSDFPVNNTNVTEEPSTPVNEIAQIDETEHEVSNLGSEEDTEIAAKEPTPPKRRHKAAETSPELPLLF